MKRPLLGITVAFLSGILAEEALNIPIFYLFMAVAAALVLAGLLLKTRLGFALCCGLVFVFLGGLVFKNYNTLAPSHIKNLLPLEENAPAKTVLKGIIINRPHSRKTYYYDKTDFIISVEALKKGDAWRRSAGTVLVNVFDPAAAFKYGDRVVLEGELGLPRPATNPGQFDYRKFMERRKIFYVLNVKKENFYKIAASQPNPLMSFVYSIKGRLEALIAEFSPPSEASFLNTILLGSRQDIEDDINDDFIKTGTVHILSVSGLHLALIALMLMMLLKFLRIPFGPRAALLSAMLVLYCLMADARPPVVRSTVMILVFLAGRALRREKDPLSTLSFAALAILLFNPNELFDVGFQLSFLTVAAIVCVAPTARYGAGNRIKTRFLQTSAVSFAAWIAGAPFVMRYFNIISPVTVLANLVIVPWVSFVMAASFVFVLFGSLSHTLGLVFSQVSNLSVLMLVKAVSVLAQMPMAYCRVKSPSWTAIAGFYMFLLLFLNRGALKIKTKYFLFAALVSANIFVWNKAFLRPPQGLKITFLDVGKGDSIFLEFPRGGTMLIDAGEGLAPDMGRLVVNRFLSFNGVNGLDLVVATHPHTDHIGGLVNVLKNFRVRYFMDNGEGADNPSYPRLRGLIARQKIRRLILKEGDRINGFKDARLLVLNPPDGKKFNGANDNSLVMRLESEGLSLLLCGDIKEEAAENLLLTQSANLKSTFLKVPHHGGALGEAAEDFLRQVNPKAAVISTRGKRIDDRILLILKELGTKAYTTDTGGAVFLEMKNNDWRICQFSQNLRFKK